MELKLQELQIPKVIEFNFEELKQEITSKAALYKNMVYTDETIKVAKEDRSALNSFIKGLEDRRKAVKKECLQPYEEFERKIKELVSIVNEPVSLIDGQIKEYEEKVKAEKLEQIKAFWNSTPHPEWLTCNAIFDNRWLNATFKLNKVQGAITERLEQIALELNTLEKLPEFAFEAIEIYKETLDVNKAIAEGQRLADIQKRKAEAEAARAAEKEKAEVKEEVKPVEVVESEPPKTETKEPATSWVRFEACLTEEQAYKLKDFFEAEGIEFRAI